SGVRARFHSGAHVDGGHFRSHHQSTAWIFDRTADAAAFRLRKQARPAHEQNDNRYTCYSVEHETLPRCLFLVSRLGRMCPAEALKRHATPPTPFADRQWEDPLSDSTNTLRGRLLPVNRFLF